MFLPRRYVSRFSNLIRLYVHPARGMLALQGSSPSLFPQSFILVCLLSSVSAEHRPVQTVFKGTPCPCSSPELCARINEHDRQEVVAYAQNLKDSQKFDWKKITTVVLYEEHLKRIGVEVVCLAHSFDTRALIAASITAEQIKNATARKSVIDYYISLADMYYLDGANIDVEFPTVETALRVGLTDYVTEMKVAFKAAYPTSIVIADVPWLPNVFHNTTALANACDFLFIMAYDEQVDMLPPCSARANAPLTQTEFGVATFLALGIPGHKLVLGTPWYGYFYNCTKFVEPDMCYIREMEKHCTDGVGTERDYRIIMNYPNAKSERKWSDLYQTPYRNLRNNSTGIISQIWYDDPESLKLKYGLAEKWKLRGVGMWHADALNYSEPLSEDTLAMWNALPDYSHFP